MRKQPRWHSIQQQHSHACDIFQYHLISPSFMVITHILRIIEARPMPVALYFCTFKTQPTAVSHRSHDHFPTFVPTGGQIGILLKHPFYDESFASERSRGISSCVSTACYQQSPRSPLWHTTAVSYEVLLHPVL